MRVHYVIFLMALTVKEICEQIRVDFKRRRITHKIAADKIGTSKQTISNQLSGKKRFSVNMAHKFSDAFGYSLSWLLYGEGEMFIEGRGFFHIDADEKEFYFVGNFEAIMQEGRKLRVAERLLEILNNKIAISAFRAYLEENYEEYEKLRDMLENDYGFNLPQTFYKDAKRAQAYRQMRQYFTDIETKAAKELVVIEQKAADGELIDIDAELSRFRKRLALIKDSYKDKAKEKHPALDINQYITQRDKDDIQDLVPEKYQDQPDTE